MGQVAVPAGEAVIHIHPTAFIAPGAVVLGDVTLAARASVWYGAVLRGDMDAIVIGEATNLQDGTIVHVDEGAPVRVGARVVRPVDDALRQRIRDTWEHYVAEAERHRAGRFPIARPSL